MEIKTAKAGSELVIALEGRLDTITAPQFEAEVNKGFDGITSLIIDMHKLDYISSAGLRVLLKAQKIMAKQGSMTVKNVSQELKDIFEVTGFNDILNIEE